MGGESRVVGGGETGGGQRRGHGDSQVLGVLIAVLVPVPGQVEVGGGEGGWQGELALGVQREVVVQLGQVTPPGRGGGGARCQLRGGDLHARLGEELAGQLGVEGCRHGEDGEVLGGDTAVLARHVRVEAVATLGHSPAQHAPVARADGVLVLHVSPQSVGRPVDLTALGTGPGVCGADPHHLQLAPDIDRVHVTQHPRD